MSKPFRGMAQPQMTHLRHDIVLIEHSDPGAVLTTFKNLIYLTKCLRTSNTMYLLKRYLVPKHPAQSECIKAVVNNDNLSASRTSFELGMLLHLVVRI
jgi:hypothetical protein